MIHPRSFFILEKIFLFIILLLSTLLIILAIHPGHNWGGDFAMYISQAKAINDGTLANLLTQNKWAMDHSSWNIGPYLYPEGFPVLIAPIIKIFGVNFILLKLFSSAFLVGSLPILYLLFKKRFSSLLPLLVIMAGIGLHFEMVTFADNILSDLPFLFFCLLGLLLMDRANSLTKKIFLGVAMFYAFFTRDAGIVLLPTYAVFLLTHKKNIWQLGEWLPFVVFGTLLLIGNLIIPQGNQNHLRLFLSNVSLELVIRNLNYYKDLAAVFLIPLRVNLFWLISPVLVLGAYLTARKDPHFVVFVFVYLLTIILWPIQQGIRLLFPVLPFLLLFILQGLVFTFGKFKLNKTYLTTLLIIWLTLLSYKGIRNTIVFHEESTDAVNTAEMKHFYNFIKEDLPLKATIGFFKPTVLRLFTGRNSIAVDLAGFEKSPAQYIIYPRKETVSKYHLVLETENFILLSKQ